METKLQGKHEAHWVTISSDEYQSMIDTIEALSDPDLVRQLRSSEEDIKAGKTKKWSNFVKRMKKEA